MASIAVAIILILLKSYGAILSGSVALLGSLADSGIDLMASLVTFFAVRYASMPADADHRFGHGKAEALAGLFQVALISVSALLIGWRAIVRLIHEEPTSHAEYGIGISVIAVLLTLALITYQRHVVKHTGSIAIEVDAVHYQSDLLLNGAVILALLLDQVAGLVGADAILGVGIALWLLWGSWRGATRAIDQLMDKEWPEERRRKFLEAASQHPALYDIHDLRTRTSGNRDFVQFHASVRPDMTVAEAHRVMDEIEAILAKEFPGTEILIHPDPERDPKVDLADQAATASMASVSSIQPPPRTRSPS